jgi:hypothetical protein
MSVRKHRNRIVNFRVSEDEFRILLEASTNSRVESLSAYARSAALESRREAESRDTLTLQLAKITEQLGGLVARLSLIESVVDTLTQPGSLNSSGKAMASVAEGCSSKF